MGDQQGLMDFLSDHFNRLELRIEQMVTRREHEAQQRDVDRAHEKHRLLEERVRVLENNATKTESADKVRWGVVAKVAGVIISLATLALAAWLGLR